MPVSSERLSHDQAIKQLLIEFPLESLRFFAGDEGERLSPAARITPLRQEQVSPRLEKGFRELDSLLLVEQPAGEEVVVFLVEEEARPQRAAAYKVAEYVLLVAQWLERERHSSQIVPVVVLIGEGPVRTDIAVGTNLRQYLHFECITCHLAELDAEEALRSGNLAAVANIMNMRYPEERKVALCAAALLLWRRKVRDETLVGKFGRYIMGCARMDKMERLELNEVLSRAEDQMAELGRTLFDDYEEEGFAKGEAAGLAKGEAAGLAKGKAEGVLDLLTARGLPVSDELRHRLQECRDLETLRRWLIRAATAGSAAEVFSDD